VDRGDLPTVLNDPEDWVEWTVAANAPSTLPGGASLYIRFTQPLGPFQAIRSVSPTTLVAKGNSGSNGDFNYFLLFGPLDNGNLIQAGPFLVTNQAFANPSPWITVTFNPPLTPGTLGTLDVNPGSLLLHDEDIALLQILNVPQDHTVGFLFDNNPFSTYFVTRSDGDGTTRLIGATLGDVLANPSIGYKIRVWDATGLLVGSRDPSIDGLGRPPGT
jgi:hypothetical protein